jgi:calcineurin-like phosphoesterase
VVDFHAEATSEKQAMGWYLDGRVTAVVGTHTHVGTVDTRVLPGGTATVADIGMVGPWDSIIGDSKDDVLRRFLTGLPNRLSVGKGRVSFNSVLITTDAAGRALSIERVDRETAALA